MLRRKVFLKRCRKSSSDSMSMPPVIGVRLVTEVAPMDAEVDVMEPGGTLPTVPATVHSTGMSTECDPAASTAGWVL